MKGKSRKKKPTDWDTFKIQVLASVASGLILKVLEILINRILE